MWEYSKLKYLGQLLGLYKSVSTQYALRFEAGQITERTRNVETVCVYVGDVRLKKHSIRHTHTLSLTHMSDVAFTHVRTLERQRP